MKLVVESFDYTEPFKEALKGAPPDLKQAARDALKLLQKNPTAKSLRLHTLSGYPKPTIYKIDVFTNKSYQITFEMVGTKAVLRRLATHKQIDREPR